MLSMQDGPTMMVWTRRGAGWVASSGARARVGWACADGAARAQLRELLDARAVEALLVTLDVEQARLMGVHRGVRLLAQHGDLDPSPSPEPGL